MNVMCNSLILIYMYISTIVLPKLDWVNLWVDVYARIPPPRGGGS